MITIDTIKTALQKKYTSVSVDEKQFLYVIKADDKTVKLKKDTITGKRMPLTIRKLIR